MYAAQIQLMILEWTSFLQTLPNSFLGQGAYNSGKPGNLREFANSGKLRDFKIYSGNLSDACCFFRDTV